MNCRITMLCLLCKRSQAHHTIPFLQILQDANKFVITESKTVVAWGGKDGLPGTQEFVGDNKLFFNLIIGICQKR